MRVHVSSVWTMSRMIPLAAVLVSTPGPAFAIDKNWDGSAGNNNWHTSSNWTPSGVPTSGDHAYIEQSSADVHLSAFASLTALDVGNTADFSTNGQRLFVNDRVTVDDAMLNINAGGGVNALETDYFDVKNGGIAWLLGGTAQVHESLTIFSGSSFVGYGTLQIIGNLSSDGLFNNGVISVTNGPGLTITRGTSASTVDLDGSADGGRVLVVNDSPLIVDAPLRDAFNGELTVLNSGSEVRFNYPWTLGAAESLHGSTVPAGKLEIGGALSSPAVLGGTGLATIEGWVEISTFARITAPVHFASSAVVTPRPTFSASLEMTGPTTFSGGSYVASSITLSGPTTVAANTAFGVSTLDLDGAAENSTISIAPGVTLTATVANLDAGNNTFNGTLILNGGSFSAATTSNTWTMAGRLDLSQSGANVPVVSGEKAILTGLTNVSGTAQILAAADVSGTVSLATGAKLELRGATTIAGGSYSGIGEIELYGNLPVTGNTTVSATRIDLDGVNETGVVTISPGVTLSLTGAEIDDAAGAFDGTLTLNGGDLLVSNPWTVGPSSTVNLQQSGAQVPEISGGTWNLTGRLNVTGRGEIDAPLVVQPTAIISLPAAANLVLNEATELAGVLVSGAGSATLNSAFSVSANSSLQLAMFDWDGDGENATTVIAPGTALTLNVAALEDEVIPTYDGSATIGPGARLEIQTPSAWQLGSGSLTLAGPDSTLAGADLHIVDPAGVIHGSGTIDASLDSAGQISPGNSAGTLSVTGDFTQQLAGFLRIELEGDSAGSYDTLIVGGTATLAGTLDVDLLGGFFPSSGDVFAVLNYTARIGTFTSIAGSDFGFGPGEFLHPVYRGDHLTLYCPLPGDANFDGLVSGADFTIWADHFGTSGAWPEGDFTADGLVTGADFTVWADHFGDSVMLDAQAVPENGTGLMLAIAVGLTAAVVAHRRVVTAAIRLRWAVAGSSES